LRALGIYAERSGRLGLTAGDLLHGCHGCHLEIKYQKRPDLWGAFRQAELDSRGLLIPVVLAKMVGRASTSEWLVLHKLTDWPNVVASYTAARAKGLPDA
jgi:hypothetical protein